MIQKSEPKIFVQLSSEIDSERFFQLSNNAKYEELHKPQGNFFFEVNSLLKAAELCKKFIDNYNLGSSNWNGGLVVDESFNFIARISFNGRIWDNEDWKIANEIELC